MSATKILVFRFLVSVYLVTAMIYNIISDNEPSRWFLFMTSCNYVMVIIYLLYGLSLSFYSVCWKVKYFQGDGGTLREHEIRSRRESKLTVNMDSLSPSVSKMHGIKNSNVNCNGMSGSTSQLISSQYSVDSIILDIEENSKRLSVPQVNNDRDLHHARLQDNRLPSINSDVFVEQVKEMTLFFKVYWFFMNVSLNLSVFVVLVYWTMLSPGQASITPLNWYFRVDRHAIILLIILIDQIITKIPIRILHFIYPSIMFLLYGVYNVTYTKISGKLVYSQMDFVKSPAKASGLIVLGAFVVVPIIHLCLYWAVYRLKERLFRKK